MHLPVHRFSVDIFFRILVLPKYWVLTESRIPHKLVLEAFVLMNRLNITESAVFLYFKTKYVVNAFGEIGT